MYKYTAYFFALESKLTVIVYADNINDAYRKIEVMKEKNIISVENLGYDILQVEEVLK